MECTYSVKLKTLVDQMEFQILYESTDYEEVKICTSHITRPGLQLAGFYDFFDPDRVQLIGKVEEAYLNSLSSEEKRERFDRLLSTKIPVLIICHDIETPIEAVEMARKHDVTTLKTDWDTSDLLTAMIGMLKDHLAPRVTRHGVFVEVYGEGILLLGESGIGKSEAAIELIKRSHRLIADDAVEIKRIGTTLVGTAPELIRYYIELRGIGIIDVRRIFGIGSVKRSEKIDLVIKMEEWQEGMTYNRLGTEEDFIKILDVEVPCITIPVKPGRNLAVIVEVAAMNNRQKRMGYNSAVEFTEQINRHMEQQSSMF